MYFVDKIRFKIKNIIAFFFQKLGYIIIKRENIPKLLNSQDIDFLKGRLNSEKDYDYEQKSEFLISKNSKFGFSDFTDIAPWIFSSNLSNHRIIHQRIDEATSLWRAVKNSSGPILEIGRADGGSTILILAASENRKVISIDINSNFSEYAQKIFNRKDISKRLKIYAQSSREEINEKNFGLLFIDGDHSYEGICSDISNFWNKLKSFNDCPPLAVFHDGAINPVAYVEPVNNACNELINDQAAVVYETWGSMMVLKKISDIDEHKWKKKYDKGYLDTWGFSDKFIDQTNLKRNLTGDHKNFNILKDLLPSFWEHWLDSKFWIKEGLSIDKDLGLNADNAMILMRELDINSEHKLKRNLLINNIDVCFSVFFRPLNLKNLKLSIEDSNGKNLIGCIFQMNSNDIIVTENTKNNLIDATIEFSNGLFSIKIYANLKKINDNLNFCISLLDNYSNKTFLGSVDKGIFINYISIRSIYN